MESWTAKFKHLGKNGSSEETKPILEDTDLDQVYQETSVFMEEPRENGNQEDPPEDKNRFFEDGVTKIDFIIIYEETHVKNEEEKVKKKMSDADKAKQRQKNNKESLHAKWRIKFIKNLRRAGMRLEMDERTSPEKTIRYFKLNVPWDLLIHYAEELNLRAPLQVRQYKDNQWSSKILKKLRLPNCMALEVPNRPQLYFTCTFKKSKLHKFLGSNNQDTYFSTTDRARIAWAILQVTVYGKKSRAELGIERLISEEVFSAAFSLHDEEYKITKPAKEVDPTLLNERQILYEYWARYGRWYKYQPLDHIRHYFGEKIGIYFAWLGFYTAWLLPVAFIGLLVFIAGAASINLNTPALEICESGSTYKMCPSCNMCPTYYLNSTCLMAKLAYLFDNGGTVFFATLMSFWAVFFLEFWKRKSAQLSHHWEVMNFEEEEERPRPEYNAKAPSMEVNPITGVLEPHFPPKQRTRRIFTGFAILIIMLVVVLIFVLSVIIYKAIIGTVMLDSSNKLLHGQASSIRSFSGATINLILIMLMANVYTAVAELLTKWEMHRTQTEYENALTFKVFIFQFVNYYSSIFYIAFFKGKLVGYPGHYETTLGMRNEPCSSGGCLMELAQQLFVIMVGKQAINDVQELFVPKLKQWWQKHKMKKNLAPGQENETLKPWERDYLELIDFEGLFDEYLEMVLQFGFITIFVAAFPIAPLFALLNNWIEIRLDARKLVCETRRPIADRAQNIGVWYEILDALVQIAVITNGFLIAFTSEFIPKLLYKFTEGNGTLNGYTNFTLSVAPTDAGLGNCLYQGYRDRNGHHTMYYYQLLCAKLAFVVVFEHVVFFIGRMIDWSVPDVPESLQFKIKRENYLGKQALSDNIDTSMDKLYNKATVRQRPELSKPQSENLFVVIEDKEIVVKTDSSTKLQQTAEASSSRLDMEPAADAPSSGTTEGIPTKLKRNLAKKHHTSGST